MIPLRYTREELEAKRLHVLAMYRAFSGHTTAEDAYWQAELAAIDRALAEPEAERENDGILGCFFGQSERTEQPAQASGELTIASEYGSPLNARMSGKEIRIGGPDHLAIHWLLSKPNAATLGNALLRLSGQPSQAENVDRDALIVKALGIAEVFGGQANRAITAAEVERWELQMSGMLYFLRHAIHMDDNEARDIREFFERAPSASEAVVVIEESARQEATQ